MSSVEKDKTDGYHDRQDEEDKLREAFMIFDEDGSGKLSKNELISAMRAMGRRMTAETKDDLIEALFLTSDDGITFEEFKHYMQNWKTSIQSREKVSHIFNVFDNGNSGFIQIRSFLSILKQYGKNPLTEEEAKKFEELACPASESEFNYEDFVDFMYSHLENPARVAGKLPSK